MNNGVNHIEFPGLGWTFDLNPVAFTIFGKEIYWYGIIIATGFLLAFLYGTRRSKEFGIKSDDLIDGALFALPAAIVGARLYYVLFSGDSRFLKNPLSIFAVWQGGLAIYGGIIGALIAAICVCNYKKINKFAVFDITALGLLIGQCIGRWGNFFNAEAFGSPTNLPWRMSVFDYDLGTRVTAHPTFFYESMWCLLGFILLHIYSKRKKFFGEIFLMYVAWYGFGRMFIEGMRTDSLKLFNISFLRVSQIVAFLSCAAAITVIVIARKRLLAAKASEGDVDYVPVYSEGEAEASADASEEADENNKIRGNDLNTEEDTGVDEEKNETQSNSDDKNE